jgi:hypothetical protein
MAGAAGAAAAGWPGRSMSLIRLPLASTYSAGARVGGGGRRGRRVGAAAHVPARLRRRWQAGAPRPAAASNPSGRCTPVAAAAAGQGRPSCAAVSWPHAYPATQAGDPRCARPHQTLARARAPTIVRKVQLGLLATQLDGCTVERACCLVLRQVRPKVQVPAGAGGRGEQVVGSGLRVGGAGSARSREVCCAEQGPGCTQRPVRPAAPLCLAAWPSPRPPPSLTCRWS